MADNQQTASDDVAGVQYPRVKMSWGVDGSAADVSTADPLPVQINSGSPLPVEISGDEPVPVAISGSEPVPVTISGEAPVPVAITGTQPVPVTISGDEPVPVVLSDGLLGKVQILKADGVTIVDPVPAGPAAAATSTPVTTAKDDIRHIDVPLTAVASSVPANTVVAATQVVPGCFKAPDAQGVLQSVALIDADGQRADLDIYFFNADVRVGDEGAPASITAADALSMLGHVSLLEDDYASLGGVAVATASGLGLAVRSGAGVADMWVAVVNGAGTPTYSANGLTLRVGVIG